MLRSGLIKRSKAHHRFIATNKHRRPRSSSSLSIYVHWYLAKDVDHVRMKNCLMKELETDLKEISSYHNNETLTITSIFFGGGTPSLAKPETFKSIIDFVKSEFRTPSDLEITMEANPTSVEMQKLQEFAAAGVNRISLGVQSLLDSDLKYLGRNHSVGDAVNCIQLAQRIFPRVSFDLIYARHPQQTPQLWREELRKALSLNTEHLSLYTLTIEPGTAFGHRLNRRESTVSEAHQAELYEVTIEETAAAGLVQYEISNFAKPGAECKHNLNYWRYGDYLGIGPGAASRITLPDGRKRAITRALVPSKWMESVEGNDKTANKEDVILSSEQMLMEMILVGLRTVEGLTMSHLLSLSPRNEDEVHQALHQLEQSGLINIQMDSNNELKLLATHRGRLVLDSLISRLIDIFL